MKHKIFFALFLLASVITKAQPVPLPPFLKWETNNAPGCKNVFVTKDSMVLVVKNKCLSEGVLANWRPSVNVSAEKLHFAVPVAATVQLTITYKFKSVGGDIFSFYGSYDPESDNSDIAFSRSIQMKGGETSLPESGGYTQAVLLVNFVSESDKPIWKSTTALKGSMNFDFNVTANGGETHQGSVAVIKAIKLEIVK